ncbi:Kelch repeat-containing protein [Tenggerimyces flavus]|uniref:Kelch repeat-containing protein n=1 Tax=Tenggerimyces flavus TaxID=1708749 RepID=A0ABV7Y546_9ACTN|nr:kelch repeat-containing protein [Tenggerimyces flavus]MBM7788217.1 non-specific serine/threonine protein kinase [Tenggerimyces flavus]
MPVVLVILLLCAMGCSSPRSDWDTLAEARVPRTEVAAAAVGERIVVAGGFVAGGSTVATVEVFSTESGEWTAGPDLPVAVNHAMAATVDGTVFVFGGYLDDDSPSTGAYRLSESSWETVAPLPSGRAAGAAAVLDGSVYVFGGIGPGGLAAEMVVYDVAADRWSSAPGPPTRREHLGGAAAGGSLYAVGGRTAFPDGLAAFESYDPTTRRWTSQPPLPTARGGLAATATCAGHLVAAGGEGGLGTFAQVESFDPTTSTWRTLAAMPSPRHGLGLVAVGPTLYTLLGGPDPGLHVAPTTESLTLDNCPA